MDADQASKIARPSPQEVLSLQKSYPRLDYLMCETLLMQSEDDLKRYLDAEEEK